MYTIDTITQHLRYYDKNTTLDALLQKPAVLSSLQNIVHSLSPKSRAAAQKIFQKPKGSRKTKETNSSLAAVLEVREVALHEEICPIFESCKAHPSNFWRTIKQETNSNTGGSVEMMASQAYLAMKCLDVNRKWDTVVWRFHTLFFYDLALLYGSANRTAGLHQQLLEIIANSGWVTDELQTIENNLSRWTAAGLRYHKICSSLDDGALFLLPHLSDTVWEDGSQLCGAAYDKAIKHLTGLGICKLSRTIGADTLGTAIRTTALAPFRWNTLIFQSHVEDASEAAPRNGLLITPTHGALQTGRSQNRASIDLLCQVAMQANMDDTGASQQQSNFPSEMSQHSLPIHPSFTSEPAFADSTRPMDSIYNLTNPTGLPNATSRHSPPSVTEVESNKVGAQYQSSNDVWESGLHIPAMNPANPVNNPVLEQADIWDEGLHIPAVIPAVIPAHPINNPVPAQGGDRWNSGLYISSTNQANSISVPALAPDGDRSRQHVQNATELPRTCGIAAPNLANGPVPAQPLLCASW